MGEDEKKSVLSPSQTWSPHTAALHRRRKMGENTKSTVLGSLGSLSLDDDGDDDIFSKSTRSNSNDDFTDSPRRKAAKDKKLAGRRSHAKTGKDAARKAEESKKMAQQDIKTKLQKFTPEVRSKLSKIIDPKTALKDRVQIEVDMMKDPDERKILADFRYHVERKNINLKILETEADVAKQLSDFLDEEAARAAEEEEEFAKKRQERIEEEIAKREREEKLQRDIVMHKAKSIAAGAEELRKEAERTQEAAIRNKNKKIQTEKEKEQMIQDFINGEGKDLTDVEIELRIARMLNEEVKSGI